MDRQKLSALLHNKYSRIAFLCLIFIVTALIIRNQLPWSPKITTAPKKSEYQFQIKSPIFTASIGSKKDQTPKVKFSTQFGSSVEITTNEFISSSVSKKSNSVEFHNSNGNIIRYTPLLNGIKEDIVISQAEKPSFFYEIVTNNAQPYKKGANYTRYFFDDQNKYQFHIEKPYAVDSSGNRTDNVGLEIRRSTSNPNRYQLVTTIDPDWFFSPDRVFPVTLDPTFVYDTTDTFSTGYFERTYDSGSLNDPLIKLKFNELATDQYTLGLYHLDETEEDSCTSGGTTDACDSSNRSNHGTATGTTINTSTHLIGDAARSFSGDSSNIVTVTDNGSFDFGTGDFTVEAWVNPTAVTGNYTGFLSTNASSNGWVLGTYTTTGNLAWWNVTNGWINSGYELKTNAWQHLAVTRQGGTISMYVDGNLVNTTPSWTGNINGGNLTMGGWSASYAYLNGSMDEVRISKIARSSEEIKKDAQLKPNGTYTSNVIDMGGAIQTWSPISWTENGIRTGDGETLSDNTSLVAQWNFNNSSNTVTATNDAGSCGSTCNGTLTAMGVGSSSQDNLALSGWTSANKLWGAGSLMFDGTNDYVNLASNPDFGISTGAFTIETWINKRTTSTSTNYILDKQTNRLILGFSATDVPRLYLQDTWYLVCADKLKLGSWYHLVVTRDGSNNLECYINGKPQLQGLTSTKNITGGSATAIGSNYNASGAFFAGTIDSFRIYSRAITANEVVRNYNVGNIEIQTRTGNTSNPNDGTWEEWKPVSNETVLLNLDSDNANWSWNSTSTYTPKTISDDTNIKAVGSGSLKITTGIPQLGANTVGLWHLDETSGSNAYIKDSTTNANHGTPTGSYTRIGVANQSRLFNGSSDLITVSDHNSLDLSTNGTIQAWIKTSTDKANNWFLCKSGNYCLGVGGTGALLFTGASAQDNAGTSLLANTWHHVAVTNNNTTVTYYVDGAQAGTDTVGWGTTLTNNLIFGRDGGTNYFSGQIDEIKIDNAVLTAEEIAESYRLGSGHHLSRTISADLSAQNSLPFYIASDRPGTYLTLTSGESNFANYLPDNNTIGFWHLDEKSGTTAYIKDSSSNSITGTPTGVTNVSGVVANAKNFTSGDDISFGSQAIVDSLANFTVDAWVYPTAQTASTHYRAFSEQSVLYVGQYGTQISFYMGTGAAWTISDTTGGTLPINQWSHVAWVKSGTSYYIYLNGQLIKTGTGAPATLGTSTNVNYLSTSDGTTQPWIGNLDEFRISNSVRTADEIRQAFEVGLRSHTVSVDFAGSVNHTNPIVNSADLSFVMTATSSGYTNSLRSIIPGEKIIIKENVNGTEYLAQGTVDSTDETSQTISLYSWDASSTFPSGGFTPDSKVFKWQREYWNFFQPQDSHINGLTNLTIRLLDTNEAHTLWLDDLRYATEYLSNNSGSDIASSTGNRYLQFRSILTAANGTQSPSLSSVTTSSATNVPEAPTIGTATPQNATSIAWGFTDNSSNETGFKIYDENSSETFTCAQANISSCTETGLTPNTYYTRKVAGYNANGHGFYSDTVSAYTRATAPSVPNIESRTASSITLSLGSDTNHSSTLYAIYMETTDSCDGSGGNYINGNGGSSGSTATWLTRSSWGSVTVSNLNNESGYYFCAKAKNNDSVETSFGSSASQNTGYFTPNAASITISTNLGVGATTNFGTYHTYGDHPTRSIVGVDNGVGPTDPNTAAINIQSGILTPLPNTTVVAGVFNFTGGSLAIGSSVELSVGGKLWLKDADEDLVPENDTHYLQDTQPVGYRRKGAFSSIYTPDCNDGAYSPTNNCCSNYNYYLDSDGDTYGAGNAVVICTNTYSAPTGYSVNNTDCGPSDANAHPAPNSYCSSSTFTNTLSNPSYDWDCSSVNGATGTPCETIYYDTQGVTSIYYNEEVSKCNIRQTCGTFTNAALGCGQSGYPRGATTECHPSCQGSNVAYYQLGTAGTQKCN